MGASEPVDDTDDRVTTDSTKGEGIAEAESNVKSGTDERSSNPQLITGDMPPVDAGKITSIKASKGASDKAMDVLTEKTEKTEEDSAEKGSAQKERSGEEAQAEPKSSPAGATDGSTTIHAHHYHMLDTALEQTPAPRRFKHTMIFDVLLAFGLLLIVGGFTTGLMRIYITHMAKQSIYQHNYKAAITILKRNPIPDFFQGFGSDPNELLNQALYLDAMDKLEANPDDQAALSQLSRISAGSRFFTKAQEILQEKSQPSQIMIEGGTSHTATEEEVNTPTPKPLFKQEED